MEMQHILTSSEPGIESMEKTAFQKPPAFHCGQEEPLQVLESVTTVEEWAIDAWTATGTGKIPPLEASFRAICGSILGQPSRRPAQVTYVTMSGDNEFAWLNATSNEQQGNREGPPAL
jgi:hypothetical protein